MRVQKRETRAASLEAYTALLHAGANDILPTEEGTGAEESRGSRPSPLRFWDQHAGARREPASAALMIARADVEAARARLRWAQACPSAECEAS